MSAALRSPVSQPSSPPDGACDVSGDRLSPPSEAGPLAIADLNPADAVQEQVVDLRPLKAAVRKLPANDPVRELIKGEPDLLPLSVLAAKADSWFVLLLRED